ncbi:uncharacterized protein LOC142570882 [Dermacentor variabilis]|uniref:uncharacterized protein LOC142570882 n=1 Tax=Dermacentor variabilis TaxID=34621 RepID=UPI003F5B3477
MLVFVVTFCLGLASSFPAVQSIHGDDGGSMHKSPAEMPIEARSSEDESQRWPTKPEDAAREDSAASKAADADNDYQDIHSADYNDFPGLLKKVREEMRKGLRNAVDRYVERMNRASARDIE